MSRPVWDRCELKWHRRLELCISNDCAKLSHPVYAEWTTIAAAALVWRGRPSVPATSRSEKDRSCRFQNRLRDRLSAERIFHRPWGVAEAFLQIWRNDGQDIIIGNINDNMRLIAVITKMEWRVNARCICRIERNPDSMDAAYVEGDRERCNGEVHARVDTYAFDYARSIARFVNEDASMRNGNRSSVIQWRWYYLTTGSRREQSARDAVRFLSLMNESRRFVCLCVRLSAWRKTTRVSQPWHWIIAVCIADAVRNEEMVTVRNEKMVTVQWRH